MSVASVGVAESQRRHCGDDWAPGHPSVDVEGTNVGFYVSAGVRPGQLPIRANVDALFGDVEGLALSVGFAF